MATPEEHINETYRSLVGFAKEAIKSLQLLNGGAIVALLAYLGQKSPSPEAARHVVNSLKCFVLGLVFSAIAFFLAYLTQARLFIELTQPQNYKLGMHITFVWGTVAAGLISLIFFLWGAWVGVGALAGS